MYLQIINKDIRLTNSCYIIYHHTLQNLDIFSLRNDDLFEINDDETGNIVIFARECEKKNSVKWIMSLSVASLLNISVYQNDYMCIKKYDIIDRKTLIRPIDGIKIINEKNDKTYVYHMKYQVLFEEYISENVYKMLEIMYNKTTTKYLHASVMNSFIHYLTKLIGHYYDSANSIKKINPFIKEYNIDMSIVPLNEHSQWKCFNDFFSRNIDLSFRPIEASNDNDILCPVDGRIICFENNQYMKEYLKNPKFDFNKIMNCIGNQCNILMTKGSGVICRLAPQDYHHFHAPFTGKIQSITTSGSYLDSVNPIAFKSSDINILNDNMRIILHLESISGIECYYVIIGASLIGSIRFHTQYLSDVYQYMLKNNQTSYQFVHPISINLGEDLGTFLYGGSTVVMIFDHKINFRKELLKYSTYGSDNNNLVEPIESYCYVRSYLGSIN
jgi:phosphatidylserine decarboxylase